MTDPTERLAKRHKVGDRVTIMPRGVRGIYTAEFSDQGIHRRVSLRTANRKIAVQRALKLGVQLAEGEFCGKPKSISINQAVADFMAAKTTDNRAPKTLVKYQTELGVFAGFAAQQGVRTLQQISVRLFDLYRAARLEGRSEKTRYTEAIIIKGFVKWCLRRDMIAKDPLALCPVKKPLLVPKMAPTLTQVNFLLDAASMTRRVQLAVLAFTGIRAGELQKLRPEDTDLEGGWLHVRAREDWAPKNRQSRKIPMHPRLRALLSELSTSDRPYLFCAAASPKYPNGDHHINVKHLNEDLQRLARALQMPAGRKDDGLVVHSFRHFFETHCVNSAVPQRVIDVWMGHTGDRSMASVYYRLGDKESQDFMFKVPF